MYSGASFLNVHFVLPYLYLQITTHSRQRYVNVFWFIQD